MHRSFLKVLVAVALAASYLTSGPSAFAQGITTAALSGFVTNKDAQPVSGATVTVVHEPSGTKATTTTRANGQYSLSSLRIGGPYTITVNASTYKVETSNEVFLDQGDAAAVNFTMVPEILQLEKFSVTTSRDGIFNSGKMGTSTTLSDREIDNVTSVRRNIQDVAVLDSRLFLGSLDQGGQLSAQGQNFRFNSFLVDGVQANDTFGLNSNGFSSLRSPIPFEAIQSFSVDLAPYDVRRGGFVGALLSAVIKSGTNEFHGSITYEKSDDQWRQKNPVTNVREQFNEKAYTLTLGGPIIRNKLFFFYAYDDFERKTASPTPLFQLDPNGQAQVAAIIARATALGYDAGTMTTSDNISKMKTHIGKLDWNITDKHRATFTYRRNHGEEPTFFNFATSGSGTSLSSIWYQSPRKTDAYNAQLFSQWTPDFRTEATVSYMKYDGTPTPAGKAFPQVTINGITGTNLSTNSAVTGGNIVFGTDASRQLNLITTKEKQGKFSADYSIGDHTLSGGLEDIATQYNNAFVQNTNGAYTFANVAAWQAGTPSGYQLQQPYAGHTLDESIARWTYHAYAFYIQDTWKPTPQLTLLAGLRYDYPYIPEAPPVAAGFGAAGFTLDSGRAVTRNDTTNSGNATLAPRIGFAYQLKTERKTQIRGGLGLFQGKSPAVYVSNAYSNAGATYNYTANAADLLLVTFNPNPNTQTVPGSANPAPNINITDPNFKQPALWKSNLAIDHKLPFGDLTFTAEYYYLKAEDSFAYQFINYKQATDGAGAAIGYAPDGRIRYGTASSIVASSSVQSGTPGRRRVATFADVYYMTNSNKGQANGLTLQLSRPMKNHWSWSASYTRSNATEVSPVTSSTAGSNYSNRAVFNPNEDIASISNTNIKDRVVVSLTREFEFIKKFKTTAALIYQGRTGHPYSWTFYGDANGDGFAFNDLLYVPTGPSDPKVAWADTTQRDNFFAFVNSTSLSKYAGTHAARNSETSPWTQQLDLKLTQQIPLFRSVRAELYLSIFNFWNLFDKNFGSLEEVPFSYRRAVAAATYNAAGNGGLGQWNYTFTGTTLNGVPVTTDAATPISRWQAQAGLRVRF